MRADLRACCGHFAAGSSAHSSGCLRPQQLSLRHTGSTSSHPFEHQPDRIWPGFAGESHKRARRCAAQEVRGTVFPGVDGARTYSAFEPDLLLWVLATLITAALNGYELIYGKLPIARKEAFYRDMCRFGTYFGVTESLSPKDWPAFETYYTRMVEGKLLASHPICGELARAVIHPRDTVGAAVLGRTIDFVVIETLPPIVRERLGLRSTTSSRFLMLLARRLLPKVFPALPPKVRFYPDYLKAIGELRACLLE